MTSDHETIAKAAAAFLKQRAPGIVDDWIDWLRSEVRTRTIRSLPERALRNHIPPVLDRLADFLETPIEAARDSMHGHLEIHARVRLDQGYQLNELLVEFDGLAHLVSREVHEHLADAVESDPAAVLDIAARLSTGLRAVGYVTAGLYRSSEADHRRELGRRLEEFGRAVAHEVRSPLNTIALTAELLASEDVASDPEQLRKYLHVIANAIERAGDLLENLQLLAVAEAAQSAESPSALATIVHETLEELASLAEAHDTRIELVGEIPNVDVETITVQLALVNLIGNAIKYGDPEKSERWVKLSFERVDGDEEMDGCRIRVEDNGLGIPADFQSRVFQRGFRAHPDVADGTGLGLFIVRDVLAARSATIELESEEGTGTTVTMFVRGLEARGTRLPGRDLAPAEMLRRAVRMDQATDDPDGEAS